MTELWSIVVVAFLIPLTTTKYIRRFALARRLMDVPNARSSHTVSTPHGGGIGIVFSFMLALGAIATFTTISTTFFVAVVPTVLLVAFVSFLDDLRDVSAIVRITVHVVALAWAVLWLGGDLSAPLPSREYISGWVFGLLTFIALVWLLNLFNFMDGIDGIASVEAIFVSFSGAVVSALSGQLTISFLFATLGAATLGFLPWNWPPAKVFMGDVGSSSLGATLGILAYAVVLEHPSTFWVWPILFAVFVTDSTTTLIRRFLNGQRWYKPHRNHAYQRSARRWGHLKVTLGVTVINICWLIPMAWLAYMYPYQGVLIAILAYAPLVALALYSGAGKTELDPPDWTLIGRR